MKNVFISLTNVAVFHCSFGPFWNLLMIRFIQISLISLLVEQQVEFLLKESTYAANIQIKHYHFFYKENKIKNTVSLPRYWCSAVK